MDFESFQILTVLKGEENEQWYRNTLDPLLKGEKNSNTEVCSLTSTSHVAGYIGTIMTSILMNYIANSREDDVRLIPKYYEVETTHLLPNITYYKNGK
jgi:hypothetical protein